jgi:hypothetical protein
VPPASRSWAPLMRDPALAADHLVALPQETRRPRSSPSPSPGRTPPPVPVGEAATTPPTWPPPDACPTWSSTR